MKGSRLVVALATGLLLGSGAGTASAHFLYEDSVDNNEIRYEDSTKWDDSRVWAEARWEEIPGNAIMNPDNAFTVADLNIGDYYANDGRCGYWDGQTGADVVRLNDRAYNGYHSNDRRNCTVHELGHAFGLAHSYDDQVMDDCPVESCGRSYDRPQYHDRSDFDILW